MRVYIESTIPSYLVARPARDLLQAARQQLTRDWWEGKRHAHELFTSQMVLDEISDGEAAMAHLRCEKIEDLPLLEATPEAEALAILILGSGLLPTTADSDAAHIALATVHRLDILLTWNCRHIANAAIQTRLRRLVENADFTLPAICTPEEFLEDDYG